MGVDDYIYQVTARPSDDTPDLDTIDESRNLLLDWMVFVGTLPLDAQAQANDLNARTLAFLEEA